MWISVKHVLFKKQRMYIDLHMNNKPFYSNMLIRDFLLRDFPSIVNHDCKNSKNLQLKDVLDTTSVPHLIEHVIIDIQASYFAKKNIDVTLLGTTQWTDESNGDACIQLSYFDDLVALDALKRAISYFNGIDLSD